QRVARRRRSAQRRAAYHWALHPRLLASETKAHRWLEDSPDRAQRCWRVLPAAHRRGTSGGFRPPSGGTGARSVSPIRARPARRRPRRRGWLAVHDGEYEAARSLFDESLSISRQLGDRFGLASTLSKLGIVATQQGDHSAARRLFEDGLAAARDVGNQVLVAAAVESFAVLAANQKQGERALRLAAGAARLRETIGAPLAPSAKLLLE